MPRPNPKLSPILALLPTILACLLCGSPVEASPGTAVANPASRIDDTTDPTPAFVPASRQASTVVVIPIHGAIDGMTARSLARRIARARDLGADAVVLEIDTPGGDLEATFRILETIRTEAPANTVAWIRPRAFSAGTIIALSTREIVTTPTGTFGDAAPIQFDAIQGLRELPAAERAKIEAPLLSELVFDARRQGWDEKLVQAFVAVDIQLWLLRNRDTGEILFVDAAEYEQIHGERPPRRSIERLPAPPARTPTSPGSAGNPGGTVDRDAEIEAWQEMLSKRPVLGPEDADEWELLGQVVSEDELLVLRADEAVAFGLSSSNVIANEDDLTRFFGATRTIRLEESWSEGLVRFLTLWPVRAVLIAVMLVGFFLESSAPGYGVFGIIAASALAALLGAPLLAGLSDWWTILAVLLGLGLVAVELFLLPGFGVAGIGGGLLLFCGLVGTFFSGDPFSPAVRGDLFQGIAATVTGLLVAAATIWLLWKTVPRTTAFSRMVLAEQVGGTGEPPPPSSAPIEVGSLATATTPLRHAGRVEVDGRIVDALSEDGFIEAGTRVRVISSDRFGVRVEVDRS